MTAQEYVHLHQYLQNVIRQHYRLNFPLMARCDNCNAIVPKGELRTRFMITRSASTCAACDRELENYD